MREDQADEIVSLLQDVVEEMRGMRSDFMEFTGYNTTKMSDLSSEIRGDRGYSISDLMGHPGYDLKELHDKLVDILLSLSMIETNTNS